MVCASLKLSTIIAQQTTIAETVFLVKCLRMKFKLILPYYHVIFLGVVCLFM